MSFLFALLLSPAVAADPAPVLQVSTWSTASCSPDFVRPNADEPERVVLDAPTKAIGVSRSTRSADSCDLSVIEVFSVDPAWVAIECQGPAEIHVVRTTSPWTRRQTAVSVYDGMALLPLPYLGEGPYHTLRAAIMPTAPGSQVVCSVSAAERVSR